MGGAMKGSIKEIEGIPEDIKDQVVIVIALILLLSLMTLERSPEIGPGQTMYRSWYALKTTYLLKLKAILDSLNKFSVALLTMQ